VPQLWRRGAPKAQVRCLVSYVHCLRLRKATKDEQPSNVGRVIVARLEHKFANCNRERRLDIHRQDGELLLLRLGPVTR
jgi:hypothetical protein